MAITPLEIIEQFYAPGSKPYDLLVSHGKAVAKKALEIASGSRVFSENPDLGFLEEAALLHDIGIFLTDSPALGCAGIEPYVRHGYLGNQVLRALGLPRHGRVCERHVGVGLSAEDIRHFGLPLPRKDMRPETLEEEILCYADKFHSKNGDAQGRNKSFSEIEKSLKSIGDACWDRFRKWALRFEGIRLK